MMTPTKLALVIAVLLLALTYLLMPVRVAGHHAT
jgi:hypothetical protein